MDIALVTEVVAAVLGGAAGEVGRGALASLAAIARRRFGAEATEVAAIEAADSASTEHVVAVLRRRADSDSEFAEELASWAQQTRQALQLTSTTNTIAGTATVHGNVVQAGHIGSISFGRQT